MTSAFARVIVVEDYRVFCRELVSHLKREGFAAQGVFNGEELDELCMEVQPNIVILDVNLPGEDGFSIARRLRAALPDLGLIMLTGRNRTLDKEKGYETGADMYLSKPASPKEVVLAIRTLLRRLNPAAGLPESNWVLESRSSRLTTPYGQEVDLTPNETRLLKRLALASNHSLPTHELLTVLDFPCDHGGKIRLEVLISRLRKKLADQSAGETVIKSHRGEGYQFCYPLHVA